MTGSRLVEVNIGDWSADGHGRCEKFTIELSGSDVSDEALQNEYAKTSALIGFDLCEDLVCEHEEGSISEYVFEKLVENGFTIPEGQAPNGPIIFSTDLDWEEVRFGSIDLLMWWIGREIEDFSYKVITIPNLLVGGGGSIIKPGRHGGSSSFGYGLFN